MIDPGCPDCYMVKRLFACLQREDAVLPNWFCLQSWWKASSPQRLSDPRPLILALLQLDFSRCVLILQEICEGEYRKKVTQSHMIFYSCNPSKKRCCGTELALYVVQIQQARFSAL